MGYKCKVCGGTLQVTGFSVTAVCEYCKTTNVIERPTLKINSKEISPQLFQKKVEDAKKFYHSKSYKRAFEIFYEIKQFSNTSDLEFHTNYAKYYILAAAESAIGVGGESRNLWEDECAHGGIKDFEEYKGYTDLVCTEYFTEFVILKEDAEKLIGKKDDKTRGVFATKLISALNECFYIFKDGLDHFISFYSYKSREIYNQEDDKWIFDYCKNESAESNVMWLINHWGSFWCRNVLCLIKDAELDIHTFDELFNIPKLFIKNIKIPNTNSFIELDKPYDEIDLHYQSVYDYSRYLEWKKDDLESSIKDVFIGCIERLYDIKLEKYPQSSFEHPLGNERVTSNVLDDYVKIIKDYSGLSYGESSRDKSIKSRASIASTILEPHVEDLNIIRRNSLQIRKISKYSLFTVIPACLILLPFNLFGSLFLLFCWILGYCIGEYNISILDQEVKKNAIFLIDQIRRKI